MPENLFCSKSELHIVERISQVNVLRNEWALYLKHIFSQPESVGKEIQSIPQRPP